MVLSPGVDSAAPRTAVDQRERVVGHAVAAPGHVLVGPREHEGLAVQAGGFARLHVEHRAAARPAAAAASCSGRGVGTSGSNRSSVYSGPIASYSERPSSSQRCGVRQPGTVDGVNWSIV